MRILKNSSIGYILLFICIALCCSKATKPITPQQAFEALKYAYLNNDMAKVSELLSTSSKNRITKAIHLIQSMNSEQLAALSRYYSIPINSLKSLNVENYLHMQRTIATFHGDDVLLTALNQPIATITVDGSKAWVHLYNGMSLLFVKEGPYWYFEYE